MSAKQKLDRLKALDVPRADWRKFAEAGILAASKCIGVESALDEYFSDFAEPQKTDREPARHKCLSCSDELAVEWDIAHGEARCWKRSCRYPARVYHYKIPGHEEKQVVLTLQYHPSALTTGKQRNA